MHFQRASSSGIERCASPRCGTRCIRQSDMDRIREKLISSQSDCCGICRLPVLGLNGFECRPSWHMLQFSKSFETYEVAAELAGGQISWHGECLAQSEVGKVLASAALDGITPHFAGGGEWGNSASKASRKQYKLAFDVLCCWPRYGGRASLTETYPPRGFARCFRTTSGASKLVVVPTPWVLQPFTQVEVELSELRRIGAYSRAFVANDSAPVSAYGVAISDEFDQWLEKASVPFEATPGFFQVGAGDPTE